MRIGSTAVVVAALLLAACAGDGALAPVNPSLAVGDAGTAPPPRVLGTASVSISPVAESAGELTTYRFRAPAFYNRNPATGTHFFEMEHGPGKLRSNANGVIVASGVVVFVDAATGAQLTINLAQFAGFTGQIIVACPAPSPVNCFALNATVFGSVQPVNGTPFPVQGRFQFRWDVI